MVGYWPWEELMRGIDEALRQPPEHVWGETSAPGTQHCPRCGMSVQDYTAAGDWAWRHKPGEPVPPAVYPPCPGMKAPNPAPSLTMSEPSQPRFPRVFYTILRSKWKRDGYDASGLADRDIDDLAASALDHVEHTPYVAGALGDGSILRWLKAHEELIRIIFQLGKLILPLLLL